MRTTRRNLFHLGAALLASPLVAKLPWVGAAPVAPVVAAGTYVYHQWLPEVWSTELSDATMASTVLSDLIDRKYDAGDYFKARAYLDGLLEEFEVT